MKERGRPAAHDEAQGGGSMPPPPPPWSCRLDAIVWWHRVVPEAAAALPEALQAPRRLPVTLAALVRYVETPVGPYGELAGCPLLLLDGRRVAGHVPFAVTGRCLQVDEAGRRLAFPVHGAGLAAPARARVAVGGPEAPAWLRDGDHTALVLSRTRVRVGRAAPPQACSSAGSPSMLTALFSAE